MARVQTEKKEPIGWRVTGERGEEKYTCWTQTKKGCEDWVKTMGLKNNKFYPVYKDGDYEKLLQD
jgi:hypothetical protein